MPFVRKGNVQWIKGMPSAAEDDPGEKVKAAAAEQRLSETETRWAFMHLFKKYYIT